MSMTTVFGPWAIAGIVKREEEVERQVVRRVEGQRQGSLICGVVARHVQRKRIDTCLFGQDDFLFPIVQAKGFGVSYLYELLARRDVAVDGK
jgi:hypothetical protein